MDVRRILDAAVLDVEGLEDRIAAGEVLVADRAGTILGVILLAPEGPPETATVPETTPAGATHVRAVAVRRRRRGSGVGTALVRGASNHFGVLVADFDPSDRPFYEALGAEFHAEEAERVWATIAP